ncbi:MAG: hypothetical protein L6R28_22415 [Planctomycetes bacterium]|nr:hypothetical protein [Planctomycetota bacterium]
MKNLWIALSFLGLAAGAAENPLAGLPSKAQGAHVAKIQGLGDNSWAVLGCPAPDPKYGVARGRSWCSKMAAAENLGGAFLCGTGVHGATPDGRYMDDLWFYDAHAHRWICLYPGADPKTLKLHLDKNGFEVNEAGDHIPVSYLSHAYNNTTYNPDLKLYHIMWTQCPWWTKALPQRYDWLDVPAEKRTYGNVGGIIPLTKHPLFWDVAKGRWDRKFVEGAGPGGRFEGVAEYIPSLKKTFYTHSGTTWFYDYAANTWTAGPKVPASIKGIDSNGCYDAKRERIYVAQGRGFAVFDIKANTWQEVQAPGQPEDLGNTNSNHMNFDSANGVVLWQKKKGPVFIYDPDANTWTDAGSAFPEVPWKKYSVRYMGSHGFYSAELNVHFFYLAGDSGNTDANMLVYRYKRAAQGVEQAAK